MKLTDTIKTAWQGPNTQVKGVASRAFQAMIYGRGWEDFTHWDKRKIIEQAYERNAPFYAATSLIAKTVASMPIYVEAKERGRSVRSDDHPILRLMDRNAPIDELMLYTALYYVVTGESYTNKVFSTVNGKPLGLITLPSQHIDPVQGDWRIPIKGYKYTEYSEVYFDRDEIIYIKTPNLREYWHGMSAAVPGGELIDLYNAAITWNKNVALGGGVPPIVGTAPGITPDEAQRLKDNWQAQSGAANAHRLRIIPQNLTIERFSDKPQEAEWKEAVMMTMRMILMNLGVSSELLNDGANKTYCLPFDASVATPTGRKKIGEIKAGDLVYSFDLATEKVVERPVVWQGKTGHEQTYIAKGRGFSIEATANHPVLVLSKTISDDGRHIPMPVYKRMDELKKGDIIFKAFEYPDKATKTDLPTLEVMEFYGAMLGDGFAKGYGGGRNIVSMAGNDNEARAFYSQVMSDHYGSVVTEKEREVRIINKAAVEELTELGLCGNARTKRIPEWVFQCPTEHKQAFLRGLWDTDGSVDAKGHVTFYVANKELAKDVQRLCLSLGITCDKVNDSTRTVTLPNGDKAQNYLAGFMATRAKDNAVIGTRDPKDARRMAENCNRPSHGRKTAGVAHKVLKRYMKELHTQGIEFATIVSVSKGVVQDVYDISVEGTNNFFAENVIVHNSNYETARASLYTEACIPIAETILSAFTRDLQRYYDDNPKLCIDRNAIEAIQENRDVKVKWVTSLVDKRIMTPKQAADELGIQYDGAYFEQNKPQQAQPFQPAQPQPDEGEDDAV